VGHDEKDCRAYDLLHEISRYTYRIQGEVQQEGNAMQFNSPGRGNFNPRGGFKRRGSGGGMGRGQGHIICYNFAYPGHLERDYYNPCTTCSYYKSLEHVIEYCPMLLTKIQERRGGNQQVQLILEEPYREDPRGIVITRGGTSTREDKVNPEKTIEESRVIRVIEKTQLFDPREEKQTFEETRK
jgi:hypothetical protein